MSQSNQSAAKRSPWLTLVAVLAIGLPVGIRFNHNLDAPIQDVDESTWVFSSYYYHLAFQRGDWFHPNWQSRDAYDHRPLVPWVFGAALATQGLVETSLENRLYWDAHAYDLYGWPAFLDELNRRTPAAALKTLRTVSLGFGLITLFLIYLLGAQINSGIGMTAAVIVAWHPLYQQYCSLAMPDTQVMAWISAGLLLQFHLAKQLETMEGGTGTLIAWLSLLALVLALGVLTKANAAMTWITWLAICAVKAVTSKTVRSRQCFIAAGIGVGIGAWVFCVALYPTLWPHPIDNFISIFQHRLEWVAMQRRYSFEHAFSDWGRQFIFAVKHLFFPGQSLWQWLVMPLTFVGSLMGSVLLARESTRNDGDNRAGFPLLLLLTAALICAQTFITFHLNWARYLLPALPMISVVAAYGLVRGIEPLWQGDIQSLTTFHRSLLQPWILISIVVAVAVLVCAGPLQIPVNTLTGLEFMIRKHENFLHFHPKAATLKAEFAVRLMDGGDQEQAEKMWKEALTPDPQEEVLPIYPRKLQFFEDAAKRYPSHKPLQDWLKIVRERAKTYRPE